LEQIQKFFGLFSAPQKTSGKVYIKSKGSANYLVTSIKDLQVIREHFDKYPLFTKKKRADFEL